jgi:predicted N-acetyltransferase YhbS
VSYIIRPEQLGDEAQIAAMMERAFLGHPYSDGDEADVIARLRDDGDLLLSLVAATQDQVIGQASYSAAQLSNKEEGWMVLGPIAVDPDFQGEGIGRTLIEHGEQAMRNMGAKGITVLGDPAIYARFGFAQHTPMKLDGALGEYLQVKSFGAEIPSATITYARAFG